MIEIKFAGTYKATDVNVILKVDMIDPQSDDNCTIMEMQNLDSAAEEELFHSIKQLPSSKTALIEFATDNNLLLTYQMQNTNQDSGTWFDPEASVSVSV